MLLTQASPRFMYLSRGYTTDAIVATDDTIVERSKLLASSLDNVPPVQMIIKPKPVNMPLLEAMPLLRAYAKYDETVTLSMKIDLHDKNKKKGVSRDPVVAVAILPHPFRAPKKVLVFAEEGKVAEAIEAGASTVGGRELLSSFEDGTAEFDYVLATPEMAVALKADSKVLKRNMPNAKKGTVSDNIGKLIKEFVYGLPYKSDTVGYVNVAIGKISFTDTQIKENAKAMVTALDSHRLQPKGVFIQKILVASTQGAAYPVVITDLLSAS